MKKPTFVDVRNDYYDDEEQCYYIDGWRTTSDSEEGIVLAKVYGKEKVVYTKESYEKLQEVVEVVNETMKLF